MKKSVLLLMMGTLGGTAAAQSSMNIYGLVDAGIAWEDGGPAGSVYRLSSGIQSGSRLGFKGVEDLGRGLQAKFVLEAGFNADNGTSGQGITAVPAGTPGFTTQAATSRLFGRQAYVGLGGDWGNVTLGRQYTPHYLALAETDPFGAGLAGNISNFVSTVLRADNTIKYTTPAWSGFTADLAYSFGEAVDSTTPRRQWGASVGYANGPLIVKAAYHHIDGDVVDPAFPSIAGPVPGVPLGEKAQMWALVGKWDFRVAAVHAGYYSTKADGTVAEDMRDGMLGVSVPFGPGTLLASYIRKDDKSALGADADMWALGYTHALSKRTNLYTSYSHVSNDRDLTYTAGNATDRGTGNKQFNVGIRHMF